MELSEKTLKIAWGKIIECFMHNFKKPSVFYDEETASPT